MQIEDRKGSADRLGLFYGAQSQVSVEMPGVCKQGKINKIDGSALVEVCLAAPVVCCAAAGIEPGGGKIRQFCHS